jgi:DNA repair photolyase
MALNESKGNMYEFITHTWNAIKGACFHDCTYCYMKRWGKLKPVRLDEKELKTDHGTGNFIFVGSSCDMWAQDIPEEWILKVLDKCTDENKYLFQTKNPENIRRILPYESRVCVTIETNRWYGDIMQNSPHPIERFKQCQLIRHPLYITIEPIIDFDLGQFQKWMRILSPLQINIGADTGKNNLPEPPKEKILALINILEKFTIVHQKSNLKRLLT